MRTSYLSVFENDHEHGVFCICGLCVFVDESELTPPTTYVTCPVCGHTVSYHTPSLCGGEPISMDFIREHVTDEIPADDRVQVIRCKDCGYYRNEHQFCMGLPTEPAVVRDPEDFCSKAVRVVKEKTK